MYIILKKIVQARLIFFFEIPRKVDSQKRSVLQ